MQTAGADAELLQSIKHSLATLERLLDEVSGHWTYEDAVYRFYHHSFKVYQVQRSTESIVSALQRIRAAEPLNEDFLLVVSEGTGRTFSTAANQNWVASTRSMLEAFFHARFFLEMVVRYGRELAEPPSPLPSGWAAVLHLYGLR